MGVVKEDQAVVTRVAGRQIKFYITPDESDVKNFVACTTEVPPGSQLPEHLHEEAEEIMFFIRGHGEAILDGRVESINAGDYFSAPAGRTHTVRNTGGESLFFCCAFSPAIDISPYLEQAKRLGKEGS